MNEETKPYYHGTRVMELIEAFRLNFCRGNALKYLLRAGKKTPDKREDLKKALWYLERDRDFPMPVFRGTDFPKGLPTGMKVAAEFDLNSREKTILLGILYRGEEAHYAIKALKSYLEEK